MNWRIFSLSRASFLGRVWPYSFLSLSLSARIPAQRTGVPLPHRWRIAICVLQASISLPSTDALSAYSSIFASLRPLPSGRRYAE